jgi:hypothetical protein
VKASKGNRISGVKKKSLTENEKSTQKISPMNEGSDRKLKKEINASIFRDLSKKEDNGLL